MVLANEVAQKVDFAAFPHAGQLDAANQLDSQASRFGPGDSQGGDRVVIGDRQGREFHDGRRPDHLARRAGTVGMGRMDVQIDGRRGDWPDPVGREGFRRAARSALIRAQDRPGRVAGQGPREVLESHPRRGDRLPQYQRRGDRLPQYQRRG